MRVGDAAGAAHTKPWMPVSTMTDSLRDTLSAAIVRILRPLVRVALRNGLSFQAFSDLVRWVYVDVAGNDFGIPGRKVSKSRIAVLTGLTRREVDRLVRIDEPVNGIPQRYNRAARVLSGWAEDFEFLDADGRPLVLSVDGPPPSFAEVVRRYSGNQPTRAVLDELVRVGSVERLGDGEQVRLLSPYYEPVSGEQEAEQLTIMGLSGGDLLSTIDHNIRHASGHRLFQQEVYERIAPEQVAEALALLRKMADQFCGRADKGLYLQARKPTEDVEDADRRIGVGVYLFDVDWNEKIHGPS